jgi:hypothetical protein
MPILSDKQVSKLATLLVGLQDLLDSLESQQEKLTPAQKAHIDEWREKGLCLKCDLPLEGQVRRGMHQSCYNAIRLEISSGKRTERQAIEAGQYNPIPDKPGRKGKYMIKPTETAVAAIKQAERSHKKSGTKAGTKKT